MISCDIELVNIFILAIFHSSREENGEQNKKQRRQNEAIGISISILNPAESKALHAHIGSPQAVIFDKENKKSKRGKNHQTGTQATTR